MKLGTILRSGQAIVPQAWRADLPWSRLRGLLWRPRLQGEAVQALWLTPCASVHTFGMSYPLDIVFLDRAGRVLDWHESVSPWRTRRRTGARQTVEMAPGGIRALAPRHGEEWSWRKA